MATYSSFKQFEAALRQSINESLQNEVAKKIQEVEQKHAYQDVYSAYTSFSNCSMKYRRRYEGGGIADINNMIVYSGDLEVSIKNETPFNSAFGVHTACCQAATPPNNNGNELAMLIELGDGGGGHIYNYDPAARSVGDFRPPRPFIQNAHDELEETHAVRAALIDGLRKRGITAV